MSVVLVSINDDNLEESAKLLNNYEENEDFEVTKHETRDEEL